MFAKPDRAEDVAKFLAGALPLAQSEDFTPVWFALRADTTTFYIVDAFASEADRGKHLEGQVAGTLMQNADELLAQPPAIENGRCSGREALAMAPRPLLFAEVGLEDHQVAQRRDGLPILDVVGLELHPYVFEIQTLQGDVFVVIEFLLALG